MMRRQMTETGKVRELRGELVIIIPDRSSTCFGCMNMECKTNGAFITAENPRAIPLEIGQMVEVKLANRSLAIQVLVVILPPILAFVAGYGFTRLLFPQANEGAFAGMGIVFLFTAAFIIYRMRKKAHVGREFVVTKIIN